MMLPRIFRTTALAVALSGAALCAGGAWAQPYYNNDEPPPPPPNDYNGQYNGPQDYNNGPPGDQRYDQNGYEDRSDQGAYYNTPPPPGYQPNAQDTAPEARYEDDRYAYAAEHWAAENCIQQRNANTAGGAVIGGILGAIIGGAATGHGGGVAAGALIGGTTGAAIGHSAAVNSPNCPPGYVLRAGAPAFYAPPVYGPGVVYAAPGWYDPWIWYGGHWIYRPYPYHRYYAYRYHHWH
jgi:hypothetical protein